MARDFTITIYRPSTRFMLLDDEESSSQLTPFLSLGVRISSIGVQRLPASSLRLRNAAPRSLLPLAPASGCVLGTCAVPALGAVIDTTRRDYVAVRNAATAAQRGGGESKCGGQA